MSPRIWVLREVVHQQMLYDTHFAHRIHIYTEYITMMNKCISLLYCLSLKKKKEYNNFSDGLKNRVIYVWARMLCMGILRFGSTIISVYVLDIMLNACVRSTERSHAVESMLLLLLKWNACLCLFVVGLCCWRESKQEI